MNYKQCLPRASVTMIRNDPQTKLPVCIADGPERGLRHHNSFLGVTAVSIEIPLVGAKGIFLFKQLTFFLHPVALFPELESAGTT